MIYMPYLLSREREGCSLARANEILPRSAPIIPIIEPVMRDWHSQWYGLAEWMSGGRKALLVINPYQKDFDKSHEVISNQELKQFGLLDHDHIDTSNLLPALLIREQTDLAEIKQILSSQQIQAVIHRRMLDADQLISLLQDSVIQYHIFDIQTVSSSYRQRFDSKFGSIALQDAFIKADNNQSYPETPRKLHTLPALCQQQDIVGFSDYLIETPKHPTNGGATAKAAAIHIGYTQPGDDGVWMSHFVGGPTKGDEMIREAYSELFLKAAKKLLAFKIENPKIWLESYGCNLLLDLYERQQKITPGDVKEFALLHYIEAMNYFCSQPKPTQAMMKN